MKKKIRNTIFYRPIGVLGQTVGQNRTRWTAADHYKIVLVLDLGGPAVRQPVIEILDVGPEQQYGHAYQHYVTDAGPVRHGDAGGQPGRERVRRHGHWRCVRRPEAVDRLENTVGGTRAADTIAKFGRQRRICYQKRHANVIR